MRGFEAAVVEQSSNEVVQILFRQHFTALFFSGRRAPRLFAEILDYQAKTLIHRKFL